MYGKSIFCANTGRMRITVKGEKREQTLLREEQNMIEREQLRKLANGSDIRGVAMEGIPGQEVTLPPEAANLIAQSFVAWLAKKCKKNPEELTIGVGHDSRLTADLLKEAVLAGITGSGANAADCGLVSTPSMFMTTVYPELAFDGSVMITASHLPFNRNGLKFFDKEGGLEHTDIEEILDAAAEQNPAEKNPALVRKVDSLSYYTASLREKIREGVGEDLPLAGLHVVVDAGNGAGGFFVGWVLLPLGAVVTGSQFLEPDGHFPAHIPNPEDAEAIGSLRRAVLEQKADLGIIFDTDVDRMSVVLPDGDEVNRDKIIALMAAILAEDYPGSTIITDSVTSDRLTRFLQDDLGLVQYRYKRGYKNVIDECIRLNRAGVVCPLAMESSGHGALPENYYLDDGAYLAVKILIAAAKAKKAGRDLASYIEKMPDPFEEREYRFPILDPAGISYGKSVLETYEQRAKERGLFVVPNSHEGVRISFDGPKIKGWMLYRASLHDPVMCLNMEGEREGDCDRMVELVRILAKDDEIALPF